MATVRLVVIATSLLIPHYVTIGAVMMPLVISTIDSHTQALPLSLHIVGVTLSHIMANADADVRDCYAPVANMPLAVRIRSARWFVKRATHITVIGR